MKKRIRLTENQLYRLIEQTLNETDWKTYANAEDNLSHACNEINKGVLKGYYSEPVVLNILSKEIGREKAKDIVNSLDSDELSVYLSENDIDVGYEADKMREKFRTAKTLSFAHKHGHMPNTKPIVIRDPNTKTYMSLMRNQDDIDDTHIDIFNDATLDQYGNRWELTEPDYDGGIDTKDGWSTIHRPKSYDPTHREPYWSHFADNEKDKETLDKLTQSKAGKDLYNYAAGKSKYTKGKGWNESLARRITESVMGRINESCITEDCPIDDKTLQYWSELTDRNDHTQCNLSIAQYFNMPKYVDFYENLLRIRDGQGYLDGHQAMKANRVYNEMMNEIANKYGEDCANLIKQL